MNKKEAIKRIKQLRKIINHHRYLYHVLDKQEISDSALDSLKHELFKLEQLFPDLITDDSPTQRIGGKPLNKFKKITHTVKQWSFDDVFSEEEIKDFDTRIKKMLFKKIGHQPEIEYVCELKIDGFKIILSYDKGLLKSASTRGDGTIGEDVTQNVKTIESIPLTLSNKINITVEGEIWMSKTEFQRLNKEKKKKGETLFANPRNVAAGSIRQLDSQIVASRNLNSFIYDIALFPNKLPDTQFEELEKLKDMGFKVNPHFQLCLTIDEVINFWKKWQNKKDQQDYWIDGVVIKVNKRSWQEMLGYTGKAPRFAVALKFPAEEAATKIEEIQIQVGRTGVLTPVAHLLPVQIAGSVVSRATLHNEDEIKRLNVRQGDTVIIRKAGDIIPEVVKVLKEARTGNEKIFKMPQYCPVCLGEVKKEKNKGRNSIAYYCTNKKCFAQEMEKIIHFVSKKGMNIDGLGNKIVEQLVTEGLITNFADIYEIKYGDLQILDRFAEKSARNLIKAIEQSKNVSLSKFIFSLGIRHTGEETAGDLASHFKNFGRIQKASIQELESLDGIGEVVARSVHSFFNDKDNKKMLNNLLNHIKITSFPKKKNQKSNLFGKNFVLTGTLKNMSREQAKEKIKALGGKISSSISSKTDFIVVGDNPGGTKYQKAQKLKIKNITEVEFLKIIHYPPKL